MSWSNSEYIEIRDIGYHGQEGTFARKFIPADMLLGMFSGYALLVPVKSDGSLDLAKFGLKFNDVLQISRFEDNILCLVDPGTKNDTEIDLVNHSCSPNCVVKSSVLLWLSENIEKGSQLFYDYRTTDFIPEGIECSCDKDKKCII